ncbi:YdhK family protein [Metabacillus fastidiosus]|uniref:YdhK family protein n=1 Tax=Metabacillus fastidiosus TaxID=1458 RepID=UPI002DBAE3C7|nr:YdhK family protein [Metabacillus fastidiosus]MEC2076884.1 YdhK family protein [Metabacillus fastidiosus]
MTVKNLMVGIVSSIAIFTLAACGTDNKETSPVEETTASENVHTDHSDMNHSSSGEVPEDLKEAGNPAYKIGSQAILEADHMKGMKGAKATIVGAYDTTAYIVSYTPLTGGNTVNDHKWVIQEEIKEASNETLKPGTKVTLEADHMEGMKGAAAEIESAEKTTVYMVDYMPTTGGDEVKNHKWVTESELSPIK